MDDKPLLLRHGGASLALARHGAEPRSWRVEGQELLWNADPAWWPQTSPILFPVVGWTRGGEIRHEGRRYPMGVHGFAAASLFEAVSQGPAEAQLRLRDTAESRARFPFAFCLTVSYRLMARGFSAGFAIHNPGAVPLPYALGLHPGFAWDPTVPGAGGHVLHFSRAERPEVPEIAPGGLFSARHRPVPLEGRRLRLSPGLLAREALCFLGLRSRAVCFHNGARGRIALRLENFPHLALWSPAGAPFLCLEAWTGHGDPEGFSGELAEKPSMRWLQPGETGRHRVSFRFLPPGKLPGG